VGIGGAKPRPRPLGGILFANAIHGPYGDMPSCHRPTYPAMRNIRKEWDVEPSPSHLESKPDREGWVGKGVPWGVLPGVVLGSAFGCHNDHLWLDQTGQILVHYTPPTCWTAPSEHLIFRPAHWGPVGKGGVLASRGGGV